MTAVDDTADLGTRRPADRRISATPRAAGAVAGQGAGARPPSSPEGGAAGPRERRPRIRPAALLTLLALVVLASVPFLSGLDGGFVEDDHPIIRGNPNLRAGGDLWRVFTQNYWHTLGRDGLYRPLTVLSYGIDRMVWGEDPASGAPSPAGIHRTNLLLHVLGTLLVLAVLRRRLPGGAAWIGAGLFAVHPVHTEAVVHLVGRAELLMAIFFLGGLGLHGRSGSAARAGAAACYLAALLSKESGVTLPAILVVEAWLRSRDERAGDFVRRHVLTLWPYAVALGAYLTVRGLVLGATSSPPRPFVLYVPGQFVAFADPAPGEVTFTMLHALAEYLRLLVLPLHLSADYSGFPHHLGVTPAVALSAGVLLTLAALAVWALRRGSPEPACWYAWFLLTLLPVSNLVVVSGVIMAERVLYLPSVAICALGSVAIAATPRRLQLALAGAVLAGFALLTHRRAPIWNDPVALFEDAVGRGRYHGHIALTGLAGEYARLIAEDPAREAALLQPALSAAERSVAAAPNAQNLAHLAFLLERAGRLGESLESWEHLRRSQPSHQRYHAEVSRLLDAVLARPAARQDLAKVIAVGALSLQVGQEDGDWNGVTWWLQALARALDAWAAAAAAPPGVAERALAGSIDVATRCLDLARRSGDRALASRFEAIRTRLVEIHAGGRP
jgi:hypothetical protein